MVQKLIVLCVLVAALVGGITALKEVHPSHSLAHEMFRRQATEDDCMVNDCFEDECITEESYNAGTFDPCNIETLQIGFTETTACVYEGDASITLTIAINEAAVVASPVTVYYSTQDAPTDSATSGVDYVPVVSGEVTFDVGEFTKDIVITIMNDGDSGLDEKFLVTISGSDCCSELVNGTVEVTITERVKVEGDPHFTIPLRSKELLCYSIQGYPGLAFNLISNRHLDINAMFIDSVNDPSEATWIGKLAIIPHGGKEANQPIIFDAVSQKVTLQGYGGLAASLVEQIEIHDHSNFTVKLTKGMAKHVGNPVVRVVYTKPLAMFEVTFHTNHLDVDWKIQDTIMDGSHGLMGQFMGNDIDLDPVRQILIRPGFSNPIPVERVTTWQYNPGQAGGTCWKAMTPGHQGEGLIEGTILNYMVDNIEASNFVFKTNRQQKQLV